jgi:hypothetical protein
MELPRSAKVARPQMSWRFVLKGSLLSLGLLGLVGALAYYAFGRFSLAPELREIPSPAAIRAERGALPQGHVGLAAWAAYQGRAYARVGCAYFLEVERERLAVMAAHSVGLSGRAPLTRIALSLPGQERFLMELNAFHGPPGRPRRGRDLTEDYILLEVTGEVDPALVLKPDPRGGPVVGEEVWLYSGVGERGTRHEGVVYAVGPRGAWAVMQEGLQPAGMSGAPFVSEHTGRVVGMAVVAGWQGGRVVLGMHPIGSLVAKASAAEESLQLETYRR